MTYLLLQGLFVRHDGRELGTKLDMLGSVVPASQPARNKSRLRFKDNHRSSYDALLGVSEHSMAASCRRQAQDMRRQWSR
jgi:hypothetical protein